MNIADEPAPVKGPGDGPARAPLPPPIRPEPLPLWSEAAIGDYRAAHRDAPPLLRERAELRCEVWEAERERHRAAVGSDRQARLNAEWAATVAQGKLNAFLERLGELGAVLNELAAEHWPHRLEPFARMLTAEADARLADQARRLMALEGRYAELRRDLGAVERWCAALLDALNDGGAA